MQIGWKARKYGNGCAGVVQRHRSLASTRRLGKAKAQAQEIGAITKLILHGREVRWLLPNVSSQNLRPNLDMFQAKSEHLSVLGGGSRLVSRASASY